MEGDFLPFLTMVIVQLGYAGMNVVSKLAMDSGMNPLVHVAYRQVFATVAITPFAYFMERKTRPKMTKSIFFQIFLCSIFGATVNQITYFMGLKISTPTIACALTNINPAVTFILAAALGQEKIGVKSKAGQAKIWGTVVCVAGALLLSFYHGPLLNIGQSSIHWKYTGETTTAAKSSTSHVGSILGPFILILSAISWAFWLILQTRLSHEYGAPYSSSALMCIMASVQCMIIAFSLEHDFSAWSLMPGIRMISSIYAGTVCSALAFCLMSWCIERKGPLYVSVFSPLLLVIVAVLSWVLLQEKLYAGTAGGSVLIVLGLYGVLWGKKREMMMSSLHHVEEKVIQTEHYDIESLSSAYQPKLGVDALQNDDIHVTELMTEKKISHIESYGNAPSGA